MDEQDLQRILVHPATMIASDGEVPIFGRGAPHPRSYGTFVRVLAVYVRDKKLLTLEDAVRKMSSYPAARIVFTYASNRAKLVVREVSAPTRSWCSSRCSTAR